MAKYSVVSEFLPEQRARFAALPDEAVAWLLFRQVTDVVLNFDVVAYAVMCIKLAQAPVLTYGWADLLLYGTGLFLVAFALWGKRDALAVIGVFAWYWGDFFFLCDQDLNFSRGVYAYFPHPMYTVGYLFMYGTALMAQSWLILYASVFAHVLQFLFLVYVENPHIDKTYNVEKAKELGKAERDLKRKESWNSVKKRIGDTERQVKQRAQAILGKIGRN